MRPVVVTSVKLHRRLPLYFSELLGPYEMFGILDFYTGSKLEH